MARNEEKAQSMLNRYLQTKRQPAHATSTRRPYLSTLCDDVDAAERWRHQILGDIRRKVSQIHDTSLEPEQVRELNDSINKLLREKRHWERRIVELGGRDHDPRRKGGGELVEGIGSSVEEGGVFEHNGYLYFGAARHLPGVEELMKRERERKVSKEEIWRTEGESEGVLYRRLDIEYFGYLDEEDGEILEAEAEAEAVLQKKMVLEWEGKGGKSKNAEWDCSYLEWIGRRPGGDVEAGVQAVILERKKAEALEQLEIGVREAGRERELTKGEGMG